METIKLAIEGSIATVTLHRPEHRNAMSTQMMEELRDVARKLTGHTEIQAVILTGGKVFTAGADLTDSALANREPQPTLLEMREILKLGPDMCKAWEEIEAFTIAAIEGYCVGGGSALVAGMDYRIAAESAFFRLPEIGLGINMSWNSIPRLVSQLGPARAKQYVILGQRIPATMALQWGLCEELAADGETAERARDLADQICALPPLAVRMTKQAINATANALHNATSFMDRDQYLLAVQSEDFKEAVTAFLEKRKPRFYGK